MLAASGRGEEGTVGPTATAGRKNCSVPSAGEGGSSLSGVRGTAPRSTDVRRTPDGMAWQAMALKITFQLKQRRGMAGQGVHRTKAARPAKSAKTPPSLPVPGFPTSASLAACGTLTDGRSSSTDGCLVGNTFPNACGTKSAQRKQRDSTIVRDAHFGNACGTKSAQRKQRDSTIVRDAHFGGSSIRSPQGAASVRCHTVLTVVTGIANENPAI